MDAIVNKIAGFGVPGLMFFVAISMTGLSGAAAITAALAGSSDISSDKVNIK